MFDFKRTVRWFGPVNMDNMEKTISSIMKMHEEDAEKPITLMITSSGGDSSVGFAFYDFIKGASIKLNTIGLGYMDSMGIIIFLTGEHRLVGRHSSMYFHQPSRGFKESAPQRVLQNSVKEVDRISLWYTSIVSKETAGKISVEKNTDMQLREVSFDPHEMIEFCLAHGLFEE